MKHNNSPLQVFFAHTTRYCLWHGRAAFFLLRLKELRAHQVETNLMAAVQAVISSPLHLRTGVNAGSPLHLYAAQ